LVKYIRNDDVGLRGAFKKVSTEKTLPCHFSNFGIGRYVYEALKEKGYDPISQLVGYLISGDPTFITSYSDARSLIIRLERDELLEELVAYYMRRYDG
jgi:uncharacterized protein (UPF0297 family)